MRPSRESRSDEGLGPSGRELGISAGKKIENGSVRNPD